MNELRVDRYVLNADYEILRGWTVLEENPTANLARDGIVAVIACACGDFLCGGATARVTVGDEVVTWEDFTPANGGAPIAGLGPFRFERRTYLAALESR